MRLSLRGGNPAEWLALRAGVVPVAAAEAWGGMALSGTVLAGVRTGVTERLARGPATAGELAADLGLDPVPAGLLLECLRSAGHVRERGGRYRLSRRSRRWLDPESPLAVPGFVAATADYWDWWSGLAETVRDGRPAGHHDAPPGDPYWRRYITGQFDLARLSAGEVARKLPLPDDARSVLDIGGGHGWYPAELCRRHPGLSATVFDLPGSAAIGREIIAGAGLADRVRFRDGDATKDALGAGPDGDGYDAVLCFNLVHHLTEEEITGLFARIRGVLRPGGVLAVMDGFAGARRGFAGRRHRQPAQADVLSLFVYLSSGSRIHTRSELRGWLSDAGFAEPKRIPVLRIPGQALYVTQPWCRPVRTGPGRRTWRASRRRRR